MQEKYFRTWLGQGLVRSTHVHPLELAPCTCCLVTKLNTLLAHTFIAPFSTVIAHVVSNRDIPQIQNMSVWCFTNVTFALLNTCSPSCQFYSLMLVIH